MPVIPSRDSLTYWAAEPESDRAAANIIERVKRYREWLKASGRADRMMRGWQANYGRGPNGDGDTSRTGQSGEQGEYLDVTTGDFATLVTQTTVLTTNNKPAFKAIANNADSASLEQTSFAQNLLEVYNKSHSLEDRDYEMVLIGQVCHEGWQIQSWDASAGKNLTDFAPGSPTHEGDIKIRATTPFHVAYDPDTEDVDSLQWFAFKYRANRFDLAMTVGEQQPEVAVKLRAMSGDDKDWANDKLHFGFFPESSTLSADQVWVWEFRHLPTPAMPKGRLLKMVSAECVVFDSFVVAPDEMGNATLTDNGYPYSELHAYRFTPDYTIGSIAGHAPSTDLLGLQELKDTLSTMTMTAANAGGISNLWTKAGDKPVVTAVVGSMNFLQSVNKPEPIEGVQLSDQVPAANEFVDRQMMRRMGQSDVSMGEVPKGMPGNLAALLEAKTVQYHSRGQMSFAHVLERSRTGMLKMLKRFANTKRVAMLGGKSNGYKLKEWSASDLSGVDRFTVESVNPLTQTFAGKLDAAKELLSHGEITPTQFLLLRDTGRLEPALESTEAMAMGIRKEREMIQDGIGLPPVDPQQSFAKGMPVFVDDKQPHIRPLIYDKHWEYIVEDLGVIAAPMVRDNGKIVEAANGVVEERVRLMSKMSPIMLAVLKCPPEVVQAIIQSQMPPPMPGMPPAGPSGAPPSKPSGPPDSKQPETPGLPPGAPRIAAAKPPPNPLTGQQDPSPIAPGGVP